MLNNESCSKWFLYAANLLHLIRVAMLAIHISFLTSRRFDDVQSIAFIVAILFNSLGLSAMSQGLQWSFPCNIKFNLIVPFSTQ